MVDVNRIKQIIADEIGKNVEEITEEKDLVKDLGVDSLDAVEFIMAMEEEFGVTITDEEGSAIKTVADVIKLVEGKLN